MATKTETKTSEMTTETATETKMMARKTEMPMVTLTQEISAET